MPFLGVQPSRGLVGTAGIDADAITSAKIADDQIDSEHYANGSIDTAHIADDQITLAKIASGTDGELITWDASGNPAAVGAGTSGHYLKSQGAGSVPVFAAVSTANPSLYYDDNDSALAYYSNGAYRTVNLTSEVWDTDNLGTLSSNQVTLAAGTYLFQGGLSCYMNDASTTLFDLRLRNVTDSSTAGNGGWLGSVDGNEDGNTLVNGRFTISGSKAFELQIYPNAGKAYKRNDQSGTSGEEGVGSWLYLERGAS